MTYINKFADLSLRNEQIQTNFAYTQLIKQIKKCLNTLFLQ